MNWILQVLKMKLLLSILTLLVILRNYEYVKYNNRLFPSKELVTYSKIQKIYKCVYAGLWCECQAKRGGGCMVGCSTNTYFTLFNKTSCPQFENFVLAGFTFQ